MADYPSIFKGEGKLAIWVFALALLVVGGPIDLLVVRLPEPKDYLPLPPISHYTWLSYQPFHMV
jgi:hypothetical protein